MGDPNAEGSSTTGGSISITAEDARSTNGFIQLVFLIVATQEAVFDEISNFLAVRTRGDSETRVQIIDFLLGRTNPAPHDELSNFAHALASEHLPENQFRTSTGVAIPS